MEYERKGDGYVMGDSNVVIDTDSNIIVNDQQFKGYTRFMAVNYVK